MYGWIDGWLDEWMKNCIDIWKMNGRMDGCIDRIAQTYGNE